MSKLHTLRDGLLEQLKDIYGAEKQLLKALPQMEKKADNPLLKKILAAHLKETERQIDRLEEVAGILDEKLTGKTCKAMQGLIEEGKEVLDIKSENSALIDILLVAAAQRMEHYEIAAYGTVHAIARELNEIEIVTLLGESLKEEITASEKLTAICEDALYSEANTEEEFEEEAIRGKKTSSGNSSPSKKVRNGLRALMIAGTFIGSYNFDTIVMAEEITEYEKNEHNANTYDADNTGRNIRDRDLMRKTADDQSSKADDLKVLAQIRKQVVSEKDLSLDGHNVKIMVKDGTVTLRGPVKSEAERARIEEISTKIAVGHEVINQLEIASK
jgi:ferritin-like metal-binding protein YciE